MISANHDKVNEFKPIVKSLYPLLFLYCEISFICLYACTGSIPFFRYAFTHPATRPPSYIAIHTCIDQTWEAALRGEIVNIRDFDKQNKQTPKLVNSAGIAH